MAGNEDLVNALSGGGLLSSIAHPTVVNPLAAYGQANQVAAGIWANRRNQADQAAGQAFQQSINADGTPNQAALNRNLVAAGPTAALAAQDSSQKGQTLDTGTFVTHMARLTSLGGAAMALAAQYPNGVPQAAVNAEIDTQAAKLGLSPADVAQAKGQFGADPAANTATIFRNHATNLSAQQQLLATRPGATTIDNGQGVTGATVGAPLSNQPGAVTPVGATTPTGLQTRTTLEGLVKIGTDATGKDIMGTQQQAQNLAAGRAMSDNGPGAQSPLGTGRLPPALTNPNKPPAAAATPATPPGVNPLPGGGFAVGQPPGQHAQQVASATASAAKFQDYADQDVQAQSQAAILGNMLGDTKQFTTGALAGKIEAVRNFAIRLGVKGGVEAQTAQESFNKLAAQLANSQGAGSDARLGVNVAANPHQELSPGGVDQMVRQLQGNADYIRARSKLAAAYPDKQDHAAFQASISDLDPRAFQFSRMTAPQKVTYATTLSADDRKAVEAAYNWAHGKGLVGG